MMKPVLAAMMLALAMVSATGAAEMPMKTRAASTPSMRLPSTPLVSLRHFDHLYADQVDGARQMGILHIYSEFPDYRYAIEPNEGFTCVDDVARGIVMLVHEWRQRREPEVLRKIRRLTEFVLSMQNDNGYFNNFRWNDMRVNVDYRTSVAELNWWSLRALWSLEEAYPLLEQDPSFAGRIRSATERLVNNLERDLPPSPHRTSTVAGLSVPTWLPAGSGADQAGEAIVALLPHLKRTGDPAVRRLVESLADGVLLMQKGDADHYPYGMFLSWQNTWHAWGNVQAYALLMAGEQLGRKEYIASALREIDNFYPYLQKTGFAEVIEIRRDGDKYVEASRRSYPQIAYGLRSMVFAAEKAYALTRNRKYRAMAQDLGAWLVGRNDADTPIYDPETGVAFDGIVAQGKINRNSGAESTIEALLTLQVLRDGME